MQSINSVKCTWVPNAFQYHTLLQKGWQILNMSVAEKMSGYKVCGKAEELKRISTEIEGHNAAQCTGFWSWIAYSTLPNHLCCARPRVVRGGRVITGFVGPNPRALWLQGRSYWSILVTMQRGILLSPLKESSLEENSTYLRKGGWGVQQGQNFWQFLYPRQISVLQLFCQVAVRVSINEGSYYGQSKHLTGRSR